MLPKNLRERLGLKPGMVVVFVPSPQGLLIKKVGDEGHMREVFGVLKDGIKTNDYLKKIRGDID